MVGAFRLDGTVTAAFLFEIIDHVAHPIFVKDRSFHFVLVNAAFGDMVGRDPQDVVGKTDYDFFPAEQADFFRAKDKEMFATATKVEIDEEPITDARGGVHILATTKVPIFDDDGHITHLVGIVKDITRMKRAEELLRDTNAVLERRVAENREKLAAAQRVLLRKERLAVLGQLAGGLAHQVRNPLGVIQNAVALLRRAELDVDGQSALAIIDEEVTRANRIIVDLLDYARVRPPDRCRVRVREVVERALDAEPPPADVVVKVAGDNPWASLDELQVQTALENIVRNAYDAMPGGGRLTIEVHERDDDVQVTLADTGRGIPDGEAIFEPLVTTKSTGVGLGLSTARSLIENHGGTIRHQPSPTGGTLFIVELPSG